MPICSVRKIDIFRYFCNEKVEFYVQQVTLKTKELCQRQLNFKSRRVAI